MAYGWWISTRWFCSGSIFIIQQHIHLASFVNISLHNGTSIIACHVHGWLRGACTPQVYTEGILPKGPYLPCVSMVGRVLLAAWGYPRYTYMLCPSWSNAVCLMDINQMILLRLWCVNQSLHLKMSDNIFILPGLVDISLHKGALIMSCHLHRCLRYIYISYIMGSSNAVWLVDINLMVYSGVDMLVTLLHWMFVYGAGSCWIDIMLSQTF